MNLEVILMLSSELSLDHFIHLQPCPVSALHELSKKSIFWSQPQYMTGKNIELNLSLEWISSYFRLWVLVSALEKKYSWLSLDLNLYQGLKNLKNLSLIEKFFFVTNTFKAEGIQKIGKKGKKWAIFEEKVQFSAWIHYLNTGSRGNFGIFPWIRVVSVSNFFWSQKFEQSWSLMYQKNLQLILSLDLDGKK